jgi:hypothetical protein
MGFFALWLFALYRATHHAFPVKDGWPPGATTGIAFSAGPVFVPSILFHLGFATVLCVTLLSIAFENLQMMWFALPGASAPTFQGAVLQWERLNDNERKIRRIPSHWLKEQWPFVLLGVSIGLAGIVWTGLTQNLYPLLLIAFSLFFLFQFYFFYTRYNGVVITRNQLRYERSFPRWRSYLYQRQRSKDLSISMTRLRSKVYDVSIRDSEDDPIDLTARLSPSLRLQLELEEYFIRTGEDAEGVGG